MMPLLKDNLFKKPAESFVGLNLGNCYVKGLLVKENKISDCFSEKRKEDLPTLLKEIWQKRKIPTDKVKISIKNPSALIRYFPFPKVDKKKMREVIFYELNKHIPFSPEEVYFDFAVLEELSGSEIFLLLAVAKKEFIDGILEVFDKENLKILEINLDSICLTNLFLNAYKEEKKINNCILDLGYSSSSLTILKKEMPFLTRDIEFRTKDLLALVSHLKNMTIPDVEAWLLSLENHTEFFELVQDDLSNLCNELKSSFDYFELNKGERIERLYLTGGLASCKDIENIFKDILGIEVSILDNFKDLKIKIPQEKIANFKNSLSVAMGLVL